MADHMSGNASSSIAALGVWVDLSRPDLDQRELGGDEKAVDEDQHHCRDEA
jgi:hypothetical protein